MLTAPFRAAADMSFYREVPNKSGGWLIGYVAYLGFLFALLGTIALYVKVSPLLRETIDWASRSIPSLTFSGGKVTSDAPGPVRVQHPQVEQFAIMIDTKRETPVTADEMGREKAVAYLTGNMLYLSPNPNRIEGYPLAKLNAPQAVVLDEKFYRAVGEALPKVLYPLSFFTTWGVFMSWKLVAAAIYSVFALILNAIMSAQLPFGALFKLALIAQTPVVFLQIAQMFLPSPIPLFGLIALIVVGVYLWQGIKQARSADGPFREEPVSLAGN